MISFSLSSGSPTVQSASIKIVFYIGHAISVTD